MNERVDTVEMEAASVDFLRFGHGADILVILPGASIQNVMCAAGAIEQSYAPLAESHTVYLLDYRYDLPSSYTVRDLAHDACEALHELGLEQVHLFGASIGGMVALMLAIEHPELVSKLVLVSTAAQVPEERYPLFERWATLAEAGDLRALYEAFWGAVYPPDVVEQLREQDVAPATEDDIARFTALMRSMRGFDVTDELDAIACPVLAIGALDDRIFEAEGVLQIADRLGGRPDFEQHLYNGYGHAVYDTAPDFKERLLHFLEDGQMD